MMIPLFCLAQKVRLNERSTTTKREACIATLSEALQRNAKAAFKYF
jgi:hypothetical protein